MKKSSLKDRQNRWNKKEVKALYMNFPHIEWTLFAESLGWNPYRSRSEFPVATWVEEKKRKMAQATSEKIKEAIFNLRGKYHLNVMKTLENYPKLADELFNLVRTKLSHLSSLSSEEMKGVATSELVQLAKAVSIITEAKYKSLLLDKLKWDPALAQKDADEICSDRPENKTNQDWVIEVMGCEHLTAEDLRKELVSWYDLPHQIPKSPSERVEDQEGAL